MTETLELIREYYEKGIPLFPCHPKTKRPLTKHGFKDATNDEDVIKKWWASLPDASIGMPTGEVSEIIVLDIDMKNGKNGIKSLEELLKTNKITLPKTRTHTTINKGIHYFFQAPNDISIPNIIDKIGDGIDIKGEGGYVIIPPSFGYELKEWVDLDRLPVFPQKLIDLIEKILALKQLSKATSHHRDLPLMKGSRNTGLTSMAAGIRSFGFGEKTLELILQIENERICQPPLPQREVSLIAHSMSFKEASTEKRKHLEIPDAMKVADLLSEKFVPAREVIKGLLPEGASLLIGAPKSGKSFLAMHLALCISKGTLALNKYETDKGDVLYCNVDDRSRRRFRTRIEKMLRKEEKVDRFYFYNDMPILGKGFEEWCIEWIKNVPNPSLIIVDVLASIMPEKKYSDSTYLYEYESLRQIQYISEKYHVPILILHHSAKSIQGNDSISYSGTSGLYGAVSGQLVLVRKKDVSELFVQHRDLEENLNLALKHAIETGQWECEGELYDVIERRDSEDIWDVLSPPGTMMTSREIAEELGSPIPRIRTRLYRMYKRREVNTVKIKGKLYYYHGYIGEPKYGKSL